MTIFFTTFLTTFFFGFSSGSPKSSSGCSAGSAGASPNPPNKSSSGSAAFFFTTFFTTFLTTFFFGFSSGSSSNASSVLRSEATDFCACSTCTPSPPRMAFGSSFFWRAAPSVLLAKMSLFTAATVSDSSAGRISSDGRSALWIATKLSPTALIRSSDSIFAVSLASLPMITAIDSSSFSSSSSSSSVAACFIGPRFALARVRSRCNSIVSMIRRYVRWPNSWTTAHLPRAFPLCCARCAFSDLFS